MGGRPNPNHGHRFAVLDGWRGIAALCVALYHFPVYSHIEFSGFVHGAYLFVDFFFVLSGFVIAYVYADRLQRWDDVTEFIVRRFGRLWPLHVATLLFLFAMELAKLYAANRGWLNFSRPPFDPAGFNNWASIPTNLVLIQRWASMAACRGMDPPGASAPSSGHISCSPRCAGPAGGR